MGKMSKLFNKRRPLLLSWEGDTSEIATKFSGSRNHPNHEIVPSAQLDAGGLEYRPVAQTVCLEVLRDNSTVFTVPLEPNKQDLSGMI